MRTSRKITVILALLLTAVFLAQAAGAAEWVVTKNTDSPAGQAISDIKSITLRQAVEKSSAGDTIVFDVSDVSLNKGELVIKKDLTFDARGRSVTIQRSTDSITPEDRILNITNTNATFKGITFRNGIVSNGSGGAVQIVNSAVTFDGCVFTSNRAWDSGAVYARNNSNLTLNNCVFSGNSLISQKADNALGGAVRVNTSSVKATGCRFVNNAAFSGGAVYVQNGSADMTDCTFTDNSAANDIGGAVFVSKGSTAVFERCAFTGGIAKSGGGAYVAGSASFANCLFDKNTATVDSGVPAGGAILVNGTGILNVSSSVFTNNGARLATAGGYGNGSGGAISADGAGVSATIVDSTFLSNDARYGGALHTTGTMTVESCTIYGNTAKETGGGIACYTNSSVTVKNSSIVNNTAEGRGGAYDGGGGIYVRLANLTIYGNVADENTDRKNTDVFCDNGSILSTGKNAIGTGRGFSFPQAGDDLANLSVVLKDLVRTDGGKILIPSNERAGSSDKSISIEKIVILSEEPVMPEPTQEPEETETAEPTPTEEPGKLIPTIGLTSVIGGLVLAGLAAGRRKKL